MCEMLTRKDAAKKLDVSLPTLDRLISRPDFPKIRLGRSVKIPEGLLERWIEANIGEVIEF